MSDDITIPRGRLPVDMINRILTYKGTVYENRVTMRFKFDLPKHGDATKNSAFASVILEWDTDIDVLLLCFRHVTKFMFRHVTKFCAMRGDKVLS